MKKIFSLIGVMIFSMVLLAQQVPQGMKYQAVARNLKGEILANEQISLRISLSSQKAGNAVTHYSEIHEVITNEVGLFTLVIGEGKSGNSKFSNVPWSTDDVWMEIAIGDKSKKSFSSISNSKLLAVPYAFHAATASQLVSKDGSTFLSKGPGGGGGTTDGTTSQAWQLFGNSATDAAKDKLGTTDAVDLVIVTSNIERMRVLAGGNVNVVNDLNVGKNVNLNTTSGATIINGNFTVANESATLLTGTLTVEKATNLTSSLTVGKLVVLNDVTESTTKDDGALVVEGGVGIEKNLNVGGDLNVAGVSTLKNLTVDGVAGKSINITDNTQGYLATFINTNTDNNGNAGDGIKIQLGKEKALDLGAFQLPEASTFLPGITGAISNSIFTDGAFNTSLTAETFFNNLYAGATSDVLGYVDILSASLCNLTNVIIGEVNNGIGAVNEALSFDLATPINTALGLPFNVGSKINTALALPLTTTDVLGPVNSFCDYCVPDAFLGQTLVPSASTTTMVIQPISSLTLPAIPLIPTIPNCPPLTNPFNWDLSWPTATSNPLTHNNEFIGFFDNNGEKVGAIRGQSLQDFIAEHTDIPHIVEVAATFINGFDVDAGTPDPFSLVRIGAKAFNYFIQTWDAIGKIGVEYSSGNGDYAEWLERQNPNEVIGTGDIVAVKGGKITKDLTGAEQIMAVSHHPIVLGNVPDKDRTPLGNNIAFMGQIPVKVMGPVKAGDYIVAKSDIPGYGVAVDPLNMKVEDYKLTVGRSWTTDAKNGLKMVNTVVGVHNNNFLDLIKELKEKTEENDLRLKAIESKLNISAGDSKLNTEKKAFK